MTPTPSELLIRVDERVKSIQDELAAIKIDMEKHGKTHKELDKQLGPILWTARVAGGLSLAAIMAWVSKFIDGK